MTELKLTKANASYRATIDSSLIQDSYSETLTKMNIHGEVELDKFALSGIKLCSWEAQEGRWTNSVT